jgi:succinoglycan biosynthesis transport protein ExoP
VTVVVSPNPETAKPSHVMRWTSLGALLGLIAGLAGAWYYHSKLPGEFESTARLNVVGPPPAGDAETQIAILRSKAVARRAAQKLDEFRPFEMPPAKDESERIAFLEKGLSIAPELSGDPASSTLDVTFRGPHRADTPKYLRAIVDSYKAELAGRSPAPIPAPAPEVKKKPVSPSPPPPATTQNDTERERLKKQLAALSTEEPAAIESRIAANRVAADQAKVKLAAVDRDLSLIKATGSSRRDRLATMTELGIKPDQADTPPGVLADARSAEENLRALQLKKAELGRRLGPEHRDMIALDEQMAVLKERIAKAVPENKGPDELARYKSKLESERITLAEQRSALATAIAKDQKVFAEVSDIHKRIDALALARPAPSAPRPNEAEPQTVAANTPTTFAVQAVVPTAEGQRVSPQLYRSMVPGGALGLIGGSLLGLFGSLLLTGRSRPAHKKPVYRAPITPLIHRPAPNVPITSGPRLSVPVFANVPAFQANVPPEKRSTEGLSPMLVAFSRPSSTEAEVFRMARRELINSLHSRGHQVIPITSPGPGDGKSTVAANLAISLAQAGKRVILVDCELKSPKMQELFRLTRLGDSIKAIMTADADLRMAVRQCEVANLFLLPAGRGPMDALDLLSRPKFRELIAELKSSYEFVIIDAPSTLDEKEFAVLAGTADGVVLVVRSGADAPSRSDRARGQVMEAGVRVLGAIVNAAPPVAPAAQQPEARALAAAKQ